MRSRLIPVILILMLVLSGMSMVSAQEDLVTNTPAGEVITTLEPVPTAAPDVPPVVDAVPTWFDRIMPWAGSIAIVSLIIFGILGRTVLVQLGASTPLAAFNIARGGAVAGLDALGDYVAITETTIDDEAYAELRKSFDALVKEIEAQRLMQAELFAKHFPANPPAAPVS